jgi:hypothetical protein
MTGRIHEVTSDVEDGERRWCEAYSRLGLAVKIQKELKAMEPEGRDLAFFLGQQAEFVDW